MDQIAIALCRWYLWAMPTTEKDGFTWELYDQCMDLVYGRNRK